MVLNFVMIMKFPNSSEIRNGSEIFRNSSEICNGSEMEWLRCKRYGSDIFWMVPTFRNKLKGPGNHAGRGKLVISLIV